MNKTGKSFNRPYEIIETEETVTRYFGPSHSSVPINSTDNICQTDGNPVKLCQLNERNLHDELDPKIIKSDGQLQDLHEKFDKLRTKMSELTEKFKELNSVPLSNLPTPCHVHGVETTDFGLNSCQRNKELQGNLDGSRDCPSRVSVDLPSDHQQSPDANKHPVICDDEAKERETEELKLKLNYSPNRVDVPLLNRSKELLIRLIDEELQRLQPSKKTAFAENSDSSRNGNSKQVKMECIDRIAEELTVLKDLVS